MQKPQLRDALESLSNNIERAVKAMLTHEMWLRGFAEQTPGSATEGLAEAPDQIRSRSALSE
jgi:hypothetical protein